MSKIEEQVIEKMRDRADVGLNKYGTTMERDDLSFAEWMIHMQEEMMDATIYAQRIINMIETHEGDLLKLANTNIELTIRVAYLEGLLEEYLE
jgi:hypothetical protein